MLEAKQILEQLSREDLIDLLGKTLSQRNSERTERISIKNLCEKHREYAKAKEFSEGTIEKYNRAYRYLQEYTEQRGLQYADELSFDHADEFFNHLQRHPGFNQQGKLARVYTISIYKHAKAVFAYAERRGHIIKNQFENKVFPQSQVKEWWTDEYFEQLIKAIREYTKPCTRLATELKIRIAYTTGIRTGILHHTRRKDIIIHEDTIYINTKCKVPKSSAIQRVTTQILNDKTKQMLRKYIETLDKKKISPEDKIFCNYTTYRQILVRACKKAGLKYIRPHGAKHGFITKMAQAGMSAEQICKLTGNLTPSLIQKVYMHLSIRDVQDKAKAILRGL